MVELLDEQTPEAQPEVFRQGAAPDPEPAPAPEPGPVAETEPEAPPVEPSWLSAPQREPEPRYAPQPQQQSPPSQQYAPQVRQPSGGNLEAFIENPDAYIERIVQERVAQQVGPLYLDHQRVAMEQQRVRETTANSVLGQADQAIKKAYGAFNQDPAFRSNPNLQGRLEGTLKGIREQAIEAARFGDLGPLHNLANMNDGHYRAALAAARAIEGVDSPGVGPLQIEGARVESTRGAVKDTHVELTAEQQEIANRIGGNYADRLRKSIKETAAADDFEF